MKLRTIGAVLAGAAMIGATVAGAAAAADVPTKSWWIDPATGQPNVAIVVGAQANASDVVSASLIAAAVGNMATVEQTASVPTTASATFDWMYSFDYGAPFTPAIIESGCDPATSADDKLLYMMATLGVANVPWDPVYDNVPFNDEDEISVALLMPTEGRNTFTYAKPLSTLWFSNSPKAWDSGNKIYNISATSGAGTAKYWLVNTPFSLTDYAGGSYDNGDNQFTAKYNYFSPNAYVHVGECNYSFGGTATAMEAHEEIQVIFTDDPPCCEEGTTLLGDEGHFSGIVYRTTEIRYPLRENGQNICGITYCDGMIDFETARLGYFNEIKFLGKMYKPMFAGATYYTTPENQDLGAYFMYGTPYAQKEKIMKVGDVYTYHGWTVTLNDVNIYENKAYITVAGPALTAPFSFIMVMDSQMKCTTCCPECALYGGYGAFTSNPTGRNEYDPYVVKTTVTKEKNGYPYNFFRYVNFMLDGIKTFVGADGTYLAEFNLYAIEDYGYLEDKGCCDPFVTTPNDYGLAIYGGWYDTTMGQAPDASLTSVLWDPAPKCNGFCPDANFDTLELQLCDTITVPDCETSYTINGPENYFTIEIQDVKFSTNWEGNVGPDYDADGLKIKVSQTVAGQTIKYTANVKIDPVELIMLDVETNTATNTKNLVLVGGPVYNSIVKDLVDMGASTVDWATSAGEWEWIADPMAKGYDVLIVAGANREETRMAAEDLIAMLN